MKNSLLLLLLTTSLLLTSCSKDENSNNENNVIITVSDFNLSVNENPSNGQILGTIQASTSSGNLSFSIVNQNPSGAISVDNSGQVKVANASLFNYELNPTISGTIRVISGSTSEEFNFEIILIDIEETLVCEGDIILNTQEEVEAFGNSGCTIINGSLWILSYPDINSIVDLTPLSNVTKINGWLHIWDNNALESLNGLQSITVIDEGLEIRNNDSLQNLIGLSGLTVIDYPSLNIWENDSLINLDGLNNVTDIYAHFNISGNNSLTSFDGLDNIQQFHNTVTIVLNPSLTQIEALSVISNFNNNISIKSNQSLKNIEGLRNVTSLSTLELSNNNLLENLYGLRNLKTASNRLWIQGNSSLQNITDLSSFTEGGITIEDLPLLQSLEGLQNLVNPKGIGISGCSSLTSLDFLNFTEIDGFLSISGNDQLTNINELSVITSCEGIHIQYNDQLTNIDGLANITLVETQNTYVRIENNIVLTDLCGLETIPNLPYPHDFTIKGNAYNPTYEDIQNGDCSL